MSPRTFENDGLLLRLLMTDLLRMTVSAFQEQQQEVSDPLLAFVDRCLREGDEGVVNAVCVSFIEHFGTYPGESDAQLDRWPPAIRAELGR